MREKLAAPAIAVSLLMSLTVCSAVYAQFSYRETVGTENAIPYFEPTALGGVTRAEQVNLAVIRKRGGVITKPELSREKNDQGTRHFKTIGTTGIGGSTLQTESVTSESRPALTRPPSITEGTPLLFRPAVRSGLETSSLLSPALESYRVQYPSVDVRDLFERTPETFTNSAPLVGVPEPFSTQIDNFQFGQ